MLEERLDLLGVEEVSITIANRLEYPGTFGMKLPEKLGEKAPFSAKCA